MFVEMFTNNRALVFSRVISLIARFQQLLQPQTTRFNYSGADYRESLDNAVWRFFIKTFGPLCGNKESPII